MTQTANDLHRYVEGMERMLDQIKIDTKPQQRLEESVEMYVRIRDVIDTVGEEVKALNKLKTHLQYTFLPQLMHSAGLKTATFNAGRLTLTTQVRASIRKGMKEGAYQWLRDGELDALITETVNSSTLSALAKSEMEDARELPDNLFNVAINELVSLTKSKGK